MQVVQPGEQKQWLSMTEGERQEKITPVLAEILFKEHVEMLVVVRDRTTLKLHYTSCMSQSYGFYFIHIRKESHTTDNQRGSFCL